MFTFEFNETGNIKHLQLPVYTHCPMTLSRSMMTTERFVTLAHDKLMHDKGCETGIVEFVVKFRVNDKPAVNARQRVVKQRNNIYRLAFLLLYKFIIFLCHF